MSILGTNSVLKIADKVLSFIPDPDQRAKAKLALIEEENEFKLEKIGVELSAILAESQSEDKWTSRARPSFLYVMYALILAAIPFSFVYAYNADIAGAMVEGFKFYLAAIPDALYTLFGVGYTGYAVNRTVDKYNKAKKK